MSFSSLPYDVALNCLARISRILHPTLTLVSKGFRSLIFSLELDATRTRIGKTDHCLYVCINLNYNPNPCWLILAPIPKPIPSYPHEHPKHSTVVSTGSEIYIIGGLINGKKSRKVLILDCRYHQWRRLPNMRVPRVNPAADVIDGKLCVIGGTLSINYDNWGEIYDPKTRTWETLLPTTIDLTIQTNLVPCCLVMGGKVYNMHSLFHFYLMAHVCLVEIENVFCLTSISDGKIIWRDPKEGFGWTWVKGLEQQLSPNPYLPNFLSCVVNSGGGKRVTVWWKSVVFRPRAHHWTKDCKTEIHCAEVSFERRGLHELWGTVEWSKNVFTFDGCDSRSDFFLHSAIITH